VNLIIDTRQLVPTGRAHVRPAHSVVDVGCGVHPSTWLHAERRYLIEPHPEYGDHLERIYGYTQLYTLLRCTWNDALLTLRHAAVDTVLAIDVIEHMTRDDGLHFIETAQALARQQVVIFTPWGDYPQDYDDPARLDFDGYHGLTWQSHRSAWTPDDFAGWTIIACEAYHRHDGNGNELATPIGAFWAIWEVS